jgi:hypothetical protein
MRQVLRLSLLALLSFGASAGVISEFVGGTLAYLNVYHFGQMVTTPAGGPWDDITFCFSEALAVGTYGCTEGLVDDPGTLYLLSQPYSGLPSDLGSAPGLIATSIGTSQCGSSPIPGLQTWCAWIFDSSVVLLPNMTYYFYEDGVWEGQTDGMSGDPIGPFPGYMTEGYPNLNTPFQEIYSTDYHLTGDPVPEPSPLTLVALGLLPLLITRRGAS